MRHQLCLSGRMITALAFVPLDRAMEHFEQLQEHFSDVVTPVLDYLEENYAGRPLSHGRRPIFAHNLLTVKAVIMLNVMDSTTYSAFIRD